MDDKIIKGPFQEQQNDDDEKGLTWWLGFAIGFIGTLALVAGVLGVLSVIFTYLYNYSMAPFVNYELTWDQTFAGMFLVYLIRTVMSFFQKR